ncbi:cell division protein SepF [Candidatus Micrarchaeota archaeon]|nr:cell division protein SepF [Candidatus Micrarchaeota archaeon]MBI5176846.1 cell division protein SepF [Candidatus Micrarchaeota archaeon]
MGFLDRLFGSGAGAPVDVEGAMNSLEDEDIDLLHEPAQYYVKPLSLENDGDIAIVEGELKAKNVVLLNIAPIARNPARLQEAMGRLRSTASALDGDIARISEDKVIITPAMMKIVKSTKKH